MARIYSFLFFFDPSIFTFFGSSHKIKHPRSKDDILNIDHGGS